MNTESKNCRLCHDCSNSFEIEDCKTLFGYNSCDNFEYHGDDNDIKERLILLYAKNARLTEQLKKYEIMEEE